MKSVRLVVVWLTVIVVTGVCCWPSTDTPDTASDTRVYEGAARVMSVSDRAVHLNHGSMGDLMGAMEMTFLLSDSVSTEGIVPGDSVRFELAVDGSGGMSVHALQVVVSQ